MRTRLLPAIIAVAAALCAQSPAAGPMQFTATTANVAAAPEPVRFEIIRWSTDSERESLLSAWQLRESAAGRGGEKGGGKAAAKGKANGRGAAPAEAAAPVTPEASLAKALENAPTVGYVWSQETAGYTLRYAGRFANADGSQRIILVTQRRLGAMNQRWNPASGSPNKYEFSVIELRLNAKGEGEGKASLTGNLTADAAAKIVALDAYASQPVVFRDVKPAKN
jgi:hypothetical protein